jgi:hypothetical protein
MPAPAQELPRPPAAAPATPQVVRPLEPRESLAVVREHAVADSMRRRYQERADSILRARRLEAERSAPRKQSPLFGEPPFYGYTWVFYADILAGAVVGLVALLIRHRESNATVAGWWAVAGAVAGGIGGACLFVPVFFLAILASVLSFFGDPPSAIAVFGWTLGVIVLAALSVTVPRGRG